MTFDITKVDFTKDNGLVPVIVQHAETNKVLMLGYQNKEALERTLAEKRVVFFSRSKNKLWKKGETSGNFLDLRTVQYDCDSDALLIHVVPTGPVCHTGSESCFEAHGEKLPDASFLFELEKIIDQRIKEGGTKSYTKKLVDEGLNRIAQKIGEEGVEVALAAVTQNNELLSGECADLIFHMMVLLRVRGVSIRDVEQVLVGRNRAK